MRHVAATLGITAALLLAPAAPSVMAEEHTQQATVAVATVPVAQDDKDDDSGGGWGLWGLAGLLGLAGLIPRKNKTPDRTVPRSGGTGAGSHTTDRL
ncbi:WGxxGxxG family protein [Streptomyces sp. NPDC003023]|uniref:WGxxGxxG family protein n=1 Tax=Streptomyces sp. NPDC003023 TaxID=3364675 RepID=UPI00369DEE14